MSTRAFVAAGLVVALVVAGVVSYFAASSPDGLEHVARQVGFADTAQSSKADGSPLSGYRVEGVQHDALSGGLAGVLGALVVLGVTLALTRLVRAGRRADPEHGKR